jgi:hypothetical protein
LPVRAARINTVNKYEKKRAIGLTRPRIEGLYVSEAQALPQQHQQCILAAQHRQGNLPPLKNI